MVIKSVELAIYLKFTLIYIVAVALLTWKLGAFG